MSIQFVNIAYLDNNRESNSLPLLLKILLIMDGFIDVVTEVGPGAVVKGVISGTLRMAIPAMLADKVGWGLFLNIFDVEPKNRISYFCILITFNCVPLISFSEKTSQ